MKNTLKYVLTRWIKLLIIRNGGLLDRYTIYMYYIHMKAFWLVVIELY